MSYPKQTKAIIRKRAAYVLASAAYHTTIAALKARKPWATAEEVEQTFGELMAAIADGGGMMYPQTPKALKGGKLATSGRVRQWQAGYGLVYVQTYITWSYGFCAISGRMAKPWARP